MSDIISRKDPLLISTLFDVISIFVSYGNNTLRFLVVKFADDMKKEEG